MTSDESKMINFDREPKVILSASGMCEAGPHPPPSQAQPLAAGVHRALCGLPGRRHAGPHPHVKVRRRSNSSVRPSRCGPRSASCTGRVRPRGQKRPAGAGSTPFRPSPGGVFIVHGDDEVENIFAQTLTDEGFTACAPYNGAQWVDRGSGGRLCAGGHQSAGRASAQ